MSEVAELLAYCARRINYSPETGDFTWQHDCNVVKAGSKAGHMNSWGYLRIHLNGRKYNAHRLAWLLVNGEWPKGQIDHIDGDKLNNRIANLRDVTPSLNQLANNKPRRNNTSGYVGVAKTRNGKFRAAIRVNGQTHHLGQFASPEAANDAYMSARDAVFHGIAPKAAQEPKA